MTLKKPIKYNAAKRNTIGNAVFVGIFNNYINLEQNGQNLVAARRKFDRLSSIGIKPKIKNIKDFKISGVSVREYKQHQNAPVLVFFHGGGYILGSLRSHDVLCRRLAKNCKITVIAVGYSLAPEHKFPTQLNEGQQVINAVAAQTNMPIYVGGDSAGGTIAAALAARCKQVRAQILFYPALDGYLNKPSVIKLGIRNNYLTREMLIWFRDQYLPGPESLKNPEANPILSNYHLPTFLAVGTRDPLLDDAKHYMQIVNNKQVPSHLSITPHALHGFMQFPARFGYRKVLAELNTFLALLNITHE